MAVLYAGPQYNERYIRITVETGIAGVWVCISSRGKLRAYQGVSKASLSRARMMQDKLIEQQEKRNGV